MSGNPTQPSTNADGSMEFEPEATIVGYDQYRSLQDSSLLIFVAHDAIPPCVLTQGWFVAVWGRLTTGRYT
jgi:hypothetical protein